MSSLSKSESSRRNGSLSRGPKTPEGLAKSALNSFRHGLASDKLFVLNNENPEAFERLVNLIGVVVVMMVVFGLKKGNVRRHRDSDSGRDLLPGPV